ncbi:pitrilysin family metalloprotease [Lachancea thermotolerans CBS 6340]|uniref:Presequence protease, mitochondrial n=1 Tax=Lachancea thermotolerans (strain ATCC 56472 / CBS 6340 / NRRL Y-8284) TaxID=559295 RepID=C5DLW6_LACTC|nr:KLTH0G04092p [Lachancea thermotolerans CBS 6340]CAR24777.1 KLTH0G04092p [Lachancea thermotolerans CBS 6340]
MLRFRRYASHFNQSKLLRKYPVGGVFHGYEINRVLPVPEMRFVAVDLKHLQTGAQHLHIDRDDRNNVFSVAFKTNPPDASGVPHILEHTTLCGSEKYPVRDPFFKMLNRSLANFMNAMTGHDYTFYPFATANKADFANLRDVYLDATFKPLLKHEDFLQEGWRLEHTNLDDPKSDIVFKGVVYNEMKGQTSSSNYQFWIKFQENIYPSLNNSGGDPQKITDLQYSDLVSFHSKNYHPSNAKTFTYGSFPLDETLQRLNEEFKLYGKRANRYKELKPLEMNSDVRVTEKGQVDPMLPPDKQLKTSMTWLCGDPADVYGTFLLKVLGNLLMEGHSTPLYKQLIESGVGYEFSVNSGVESTTATNFFTVGVQGCSDTILFEQTVKSVFQEALEKPFESDKIEAIIQQLELSKKNQKADFGLQLLYSLVPGWTNKTDPFDHLVFDDILSQFRADWAAKGDEVFREIIRDQILSKPCFYFSMEADEKYSGMLDSEEARRLETKVSQLDSNDREVIRERGKQLQAKQNATEDLSCLPSLKIKDIPRAGDSYEIKRADNIFHRISDTNGITYLRLKRSLDRVIPRDLYPYLPIFADCLTSLGTSKEHYSEIEDEMKLHTGGVSAHVAVHSDPITCEPSLNFICEGYSLNHKTERVFDIWRKILVETDIVKHVEKLKVLIRSLAASNTASVAEGGHAFARNFTGAHLTTAKAINESLSGVEQLKLITYLSTILEKPALFQAEVVDKLNELKSYVISSEGLEFFTTTDSEKQAIKTDNEIQQFVQTLPEDSPSMTFSSRDYPLLDSKGKHTLIEFPFQVHYSAQSLVGVPYTHRDGASLQVLSNMLTFKHLHREIREKGGAYGGGATYSALDGLFSFYSYRDPHPLNSLQVFAESGNYVLQNSNWKNDDLNEAKLTIFQQVDAPISPSSEGSILFNYGITDSMRQVRREQLLDVNLEDVRAAAEKYLFKKPSVTAVVGPRIEAEMSDGKWQIKDLQPAK